MITNLVNEENLLIKKYLHRQTAANSFTALSGGLQSSKNGFAAYCANVSATIVLKIRKKYLSIN